MAGPRDECLIASVGRDKCSHVVCVSCFTRMNCAFDYEDSDSQVERVRVCPCGCLFIPYWNQ